MMKKKKQESIFASLLNSDNWASGITKRNPIDTNPLLRHIHDQHVKYHIELKKYYSDYEERNEENPFNWAWDRKRGRPSNAVLMGRIFNELWHKDKVAKFGSNPFAEYDEKFSEKREPKTLRVNYNTRLS